MHSDEDSGEIEEVIDVRKRVSGRAAEHYKLVRYTLDQISDSRLLLDEDYQAIESYSPDRCEIVNSISNQCVTMALSFTGGTCFTRFRHPFFLGLTIAPIIIHFSHSTYKGITIVQCRKKIYTMVSLLKKMYAANKRVRQYFAKREHSDKKLKDNLKSKFVMNLILKDERKLAVSYAQNLLNVITSLRHYIAAIARKLDDHSSYTGLFDIDLKMALIPNDADTASVIVTFERLYDIYLLMVSSFLSCVAVCICSNLYKNYDTIEFILYNIIPQVNNSIRNEIQECHNKAESIYYVLNLQQPHRTVHNPTVASIYTRPLTEYMHSMKLEFDYMNALRTLIQEEPNAHPQYIEELLAVVHEQHLMSATYLDILFKFNATAMRKKFPKYAPVRVSAKPTPLPSAAVMLSEDSRSRFDIGKLNVEEVYEGETGKGSHSNKGSKGDPGSVKSYAELKALTDQLLMKELDGKLKLVRSRMSIVSRTKSQPFEPLFPMESAITSPNFRECVAASAPPIPDYCDSMQFSTDQEEVVVAKVPEVQKSESDDSTIDYSSRTGLLTRSSYEGTLQAASTTSVGPIPVPPPSMDGSFDTSLGSNPNLQVSIFESITELAKAMARGEEIFEMEAEEP